MVRRFLAACSVLALVALPQAASAASTTSNVGGNALQVSPVRTSVTIQPGTSQTVDVYIQNLTAAPATLSAVIDDFTAGNNENGEPNILLDGQEAPTHSLKQFVAPVGDLTLAAHAQKDVKVTITIPKATAGGGYYGVVRFEPAANSSDKNVNLSASVGSLVLVKVPGAVTEKMSLASLDVRKFDTHNQTDGSPSTLFTSNKNLDAVVRFQNQGNVQLAPFGKLVLKRGGKQIALYEVNNASEPGNVLPGSIRRFAIRLNGIGSIGKYTLEGNFGYGTKGQLLTASKTFYIIPVAAIVVAVVAVIALIALVFGFPKLLHAYNRRVIRRANQGKRT